MRPAPALPQAEPNGVYAEVVRKVLGLDICADTAIGGPMLRGVSGGQRKRVTVGEWQPELLLSCAAQSSTVALRSWQLRQLWGLPHDHDPGSNLNADSPPPQARCSSAPSA